MLINVDVSLAISEYTPNIFMCTYIFTNNLFIYYYHYYNIDVLSIDLPCVMRSVGHILHHKLCVLVEWRVLMCIGLFGM